MSSNSENDKQLKRNEKRK